MEGFREPPLEHLDSGPWTSNTNAVRSWNQPTQTRTAAGQTQISLLQKAFDIVDLGLNRSSVSPIGFIVKLILIEVINVDRPKLVLPGVFRHFLRSTCLHTPSYGLKPWLLGEERRAGASRSLVGGVGRRNHLPILAVQSAVQCSAWKGGSRSVDRRRSSEHSASAATRRIACSRSSDVIDLHKNEKFRKIQVSSARVRVQYNGCKKFSHFFALSLALASGSEITHALPWRGSKQTARSGVFSFDTLQLSISQRKLHVHIKFAWFVKKKKEKEKGEKALV